MDLTAELNGALEEALSRSNHFLENGNPAKAAGEYARAAHLLTQIAKQTQSPGLKRQRFRRAKGYADRAQALRRGVREQLSNSAPAKMESSEGDGLAARVRTLIQETNIRWEQIAGLEEVKSQIRSLFAIALAQKPEGVVVEKRPNVLLYGPPGTGKTLIAAAASGSLDATFYSVKAGDLLSRYFGESSRLVETLYQEAFHTEPSVVFLDEFETLTPDRDSPGGVSGPESRILAQFLAELDGVNTKSAEEIVITIAATNKPWALDDAVLSRFARSVYVPLPDQATRSEIFRLEVEGKGFDSEAPWEELAAATSGRSGREIAVACREAARDMLLRVNPGLDGKGNEDAESIRKYRLNVHPVTEAEVLAALSRVRVLTGETMLKRYEEWGAVH